MFSNVYLNRSIRIREGAELVKVVPSHIVCLTHRHYTKTNSNLTGSVLCNLHLQFQAICSHLTFHLWDKSSKFPHWLLSVSSNAAPFSLNSDTPENKGGHSHMSVDIHYLSLDPHFYANLTPNGPLFSSGLHTQCPPFFFSPNFEKFTHFAALLIQNLQILAWIWNCIFAHFMTPIYPHQKRQHFLEPTLNDPLFFNEILHWPPLRCLFSRRHMYVTFIWMPPPLWELFA